MCHSFDRAKGMMMSAEIEAVTSGLTQFNTTTHGAFKIDRWRQRRDDDDIDNFFDGIAVN
jgi:hypothetical protein